VSFEPGSKLQQIQSGAFYGCLSLRSICIPSISAFNRGCLNATAIVGLTFESGAELCKVPEQLFMELSLLQYINIPACVEVLGNGCFSDCRSLSRLAFEPGSKLNRIEDKVFTRCIALRSLSLPASVEILADKWLSGSAIETLTIESGSTLRQIEESLFLTCWVLRCIFVPASIRFIPTNAIFQQISAPGSPVILLVRIVSNRVPLFNPLCWPIANSSSDGFLEGYDQCLKDLTNRK
jgi:hypothetical protein